MIARKMSLGFFISGLLYAAIACGDTYRCFNSKKQFEFTNRPCASDGSLTPAPSKRSDGALCPMHLASQPRSSGGNDWQSRELDNLEARLYMDARSGKIGWVQLVEKFYARCAELYRGYRNEDHRDLPAYQRVLAEKMDARSINESEWIFLQESKLAERHARNQLIMNTRPSPNNRRGTHCTTLDLGGVYTTSCD